MSTTTAHSSAIKLFKKYQYLKIPAECVNKDLDPYVSIDKIDFNFNEDTWISTIKYVDSNKACSNSDKRIILKLYRKRSILSKDLSFFEQLQNYEPKNKKLKTDICNICNKLYDIEKLEKHRSKHLRCQYCKNKFRDLMKKDDHIINVCPVKNRMVNLPKMCFEKVNENLKYYDNSRVDVHLDYKTFSKNMSTKFQGNNLGGNEKDPSENMVRCPGDNENEIIEGTLSQQKFKTDDNFLPKVDSTTKIICIKPNILVNGRNLITTDDKSLKESNMIKNLAKFSIKEPLKKHTTTQTNAISSIEINISDTGCDLKHLNEILKGYYAVPITLIHGTFDIKVKSEEQELRNKKEYWNDVNVTDVKPIIQSVYKNEVECYKNINM